MNALLTHAVTLHNIQVGLGQDDKGEGFINITGQAEDGTSVPITIDIGNEGYNALIVQDFVIGIDDVLLGVDPQDGEEELVPETRSFWEIVKGVFRG